MTTNSQTDKLFHQQLKFRIPTQISG